MPACLPYLSLSANALSQVGELEVERETVKGQQATAFFMLQLFILICFYFVFLLSLYERNF
jgi:hypothetical protein